MDAREQPHYGLIDILPVVEHPSLPNVPGPPSVRPLFPFLLAGGTPGNETWLVVNATGDIGLGRTGPRAPPAPGDALRGPGPPGPWTGTPGLAGG